MSLGIILHSMQLPVLQELKSVSNVSYFNNEIPHILTGHVRIRIAWITSCCLISHSFKNVFTFSWRPSFNQPELSHQFCDIKFMTFTSKNKINLVINSLKKPMTILLNMHHQVDLVWNVQWQMSVHCHLTSYYATSLCQQLNRSLCPNNWSLCQMCPNLIMNHLLLLLAIVFKHRK